QIILVLALNGQALGHEHSHNYERHIFDAHDLADRVFSGKELIGDGFADDRHLVRATHVLFAEGRAGNDWPLADIEIIWRLAQDLRVPILVSRRDLRPGSNLGADHGDTRDLALNSFGVLDG